MTTQSKPRGDATKRLKCAVCGSYSIAFVTGAPKCTICDSVYTELEQPPVAKEANAAQVQSDPSLDAATFQERVRPWLVECFGTEIAYDQTERNHRFVEEALELAQSCGFSDDEAHQLVNYVFSRPIGQKGQETGGVMVTLAALCLSHGLGMNECGEVELSRIWTKIETIRAKQAAKPKHSPSPVSAPAVPAEGTPQVDAFLAARHDRNIAWTDEEKDFVRTLERENARLRADLARVTARLSGFRDCVLNGRHQLEAPCLDNDQTNAVLSLFDDHFPQPPAGEASATEGEQP